MVQESEQAEEQQQPEPGARLIVRPRARVAIRPDQAAIAETVQSMIMLRENIRTLLTEEVDYGHIPGIPGKMLFDCGASKLINAFNCYAGERRVINFVDDGSKVAIMVEVPLIDRATGQVVLTGIGAASTLETKHKYRWSDNLDELLAMGYDEEKRKNLKTRLDTKTGVISYRVPNPEHGDLLNTIVKMASKRAEVDVAESLPGVGSTLKLMFDHRLAALATGTTRPPLSEYERHPGQPPGGPPSGDKDDSWSQFWGEVMRMGLTRDQVLAFFKTPSMGNYVTEKQKTHQDLLFELREALKDGALK